MKIVITILLMILLARWLVAAPTVSEPHTLEVQLATYYGTGKFNI